MKSENHKQQTQTGASNHKIKKTHTHTQKQTNKQNKKNTNKRIKSQKIKTKKHRIC
jgi:hypothetical protein